MTRASPYASIGTRDVKTACPGDRPAAWTGVRQTPAAGRRGVRPLDRARPRCGSTAPSSWPQRITAEAADVVVVESDSVRGPVFDLGLRAIASTRGDPNNVDIAGATAAGIPVLNTPARNADAVAEMAVALLLAATRHLVTADCGCPQRQHVSRRQHSLSAVPGLGDRRAHRRAGGPGRRRPGLAVAAVRAGPAGHRPRPVQRRSPSTASTSCWARPTSSRCTHRSPTTPSG